MPRQLVLAVFFALFLPAVARPAVVTWTGAAGTNLWSNAGNWNPPGVPQNGDDLIFPDGPAIRDVHYDLSDASYGSVTVSGSAYTLSAISGSFRLSSGIFVPASGSVDWRIDTSFTGSATIRSSGSFWAQSGPFVFRNPSTSTLTLDALSGTIPIQIYEIADSGTVVKTGPGLADVSHIYGQLVVNEGSMAASGGHSPPVNAAYSLPVTVNGGTFCGGVDLATLTVQSGATLDPGCAGPENPGYVASESVIYQAGARAVFDLQPPLANDRVSYRDSANLNGANLELRQNSIPPVGSRFTLIEATNSLPMGTVTGTFSGLPEGSLFNVGPVTYRITYRGGGGANNVEITVVQSPALSISDVTANENEAVAVFTVSLSAASGAPVTVSYETQDATAHAGSDYVATAGSLTFAPGETTKTITVPILDDAIEEPTETFQVRLFQASGADIADNLGVGTIVDNDSCTPPVIAEQPSPETTVPRGASVTLSVSATGTDPLSYQWYIGVSGDDSSPIPGATGSTHTANNIISTMSFWASVSNRCGSVASNSARVIVPGRRRAVRP